MNNAQVVMVLIGSATSSTYAPATPNALRLCLGACGKIFKMSSKTIETSSCVLECEWKTVVGHVSVSAFCSRRIEVACGACVLKSGETHTEAVPPAN